MKFDPKDPKWTAYALGELGARERAAVETLLRASPEARACVEGIRELAGALERELRAEPCPALGEERREAIRRAIDSRGQAAAHRRPRRRLRLALAACALAALTIGVLTASGLLWKGSAPVAGEGRKLARRGATAPAPMRTPAESRARETMAWLSRLGYTGPFGARAHHSVVYGITSGLGFVDVAPGESASESYDSIPENRFRDVAAHPVSTFSIDVDSASYANVRRFLREGRLPPGDSVRLEEMVNYFAYDYPEPEPGVPFSVTLEAAGCPWIPSHRLVRIGLKGREVPLAERPPMNLVFLLDVSGSMRSPRKLPLVKRSLKMLSARLDSNDRVAIAVYAGASGLVLPSTTADNRADILEALERLSAGGSTNGGEGIRLAYDVARENFLARGVNRVILCTDGDFNVGITDQGSLVRLVEEQARDGIDLTVLGFGMGNLKDSTLEKLADKGNGNYGYVDAPAEARKLLVEQLTGTLVTIARDVKVQVEFNPREVRSYRLLGYENRLLAREDFNDDARDAGEIGAGHTVTALYEVVPAGTEPDAAAPPPVDPLRYQIEREPSSTAFTGEMLLLRLRYKEAHAPAGPSRLIEMPLADRGDPYRDASPDFKFAAAVAAFAMVLRDSPSRGSASLEGVLELAAEGIGPDPRGRRAEFLDLVRRAQEIGGR